MKNKITREEEIFLKKEAHLQKIEGIAKRRGYEEETLTENHYEICHSVSSQIRSNQFKSMVIGFMLIDALFSALAVFVAEKIMSLESELDGIIFWLKEHGCSNMGGTIITTTLITLVAFLVVNRNDIRAYFLKIHVLDYKEYLALKEDDVEVEAKTEDSNTTNVEVKVSVDAEAEIEIFINVEVLTKKKKRKKKDKKKDKKKK